MNLACGEVTAAVGLGLSLNGQRADEAAKGNAESTEMLHTEDSITDWAKVKESREWDFCLTCSDWCR